MILTSENIYTRVSCSDTYNCRNFIEELITYQVKNKQVSLFMDRTASNRSIKYKVVFYDWDKHDKAETDITFVVYPKKCMDHSTIIGNNSIYLSNAAIQRNFREILKALGRLYNLPICSKHI